MKIVTKNVVDLTREEYSWCSRATLHGQRSGIEGEMHSVLSDYRKEPYSAKTDNVRAVMLIDESRTGAAGLIAWALTFSDNVYFWTKHRHRNKGYGTMLMREVKKTLPKPKVYPWTVESGGFFSKFHIENGYGEWSSERYLTDKPKVC